MVLYKSILQNDKKREESAIIYKKTIFREIKIEHLFEKNVEICYTNTK